MSHHQVAPPQSGSVPTGQAVERPGTLTAMPAISVLSAVSAFVGAILVFAGGKDLAVQNLKDALAEHPDLAGLPAGGSADIKGLPGPLWESLVDARYDSLVARAVFALVLGVCVLVFGLCARSGATWARVLLTISAVVALLPHVLIAGDYEPTSVMLTSLLAMATALAAIVVGWLPPNGRYAKQLRQGKAGAPAL
ncbi:hypothetical protein [Streptomyces sp. NPDC048650]|uniref:hypothetical protein n=1 Tax=unclassified Streptomyces TaxID=2593676 RepID=UPI003712A21C